MFNSKRIARLEKEVEGLEKEMQRLRECRRADMHCVEDRFAMLQEALGYERVIIPGKVEYRKIGKRKAV
jgi:hypothetical protein